MKAPDGSRKAEKPAPRSKPPLPRGSASERQLADVGELLEEKFAIVFTALTPVAPVTAMYGVENSPKAIKALLDIGKRRPAVMKALLKFADGADSLALAQFLAGTIVAVQVDMNRLRGDELPARTFGVTAVIEKYFMAEADPPDNPYVTEQVISSGARFSPVS